MNKATTRPLPCRLRGVLDGFLAAMVSLFVMGIAHSQTMPQDNWRYDGTNFGSPVANNSLKVITSGSGGIYVGEIVSGSSSPTKILRFSENGIFINRFTDSFTYLLGMGTDSAGNVYAFDRGDSRVKVYSPTGTFLRQWGGVGTANGLFSVSASITTANILSVSSEDEVFVCDPGNTRVQVFSTAGTFLRKWGELGSLPGQFSAGQPLNIVVGGDGLVWLNAKRFKKNGEFYDTTNRNAFSGSKDAVIAIDGNYPQYFSDSTFTSNRSVINSAGNNFVFPNDSAFSKSGALFSCSGPKCYRFVREYASAINFLNPLPLPQAEIISSSQRPGTNLVDVSYRVTDTDNPTVTTALLAFIDGGDSIGQAVPMRTFVENTSGNVGVNQPVDSIRNVVWNMSADWSVTYANIRVEALAKDARNLMGVHWITVPPSNGQPAIQVSYEPISEADLHPIWLWQLASTQEVAITRLNGNATLTGTGGIYNGSVLYSSTLNYPTTQAGRVFALKKMGARPITEAELTRARAGNYGFSGSIVSTHPTQGPSFIVKDDTVATSYINASGTNSEFAANLQSFSSNNPVSIDSGYSHNLIIRSDGSLWGYGANGQGQLGLGHTSNQSGPVKIADGVAQCSAGQYHSVFVKTDGTLWAMGQNAYGQLGNNSTVQSNTPVQVTTGVAQASAGNDHTLFVKTNGTAWAMGKNDYGQLGDASNTQRLLPVQVTAATNFSKVEAANYYSFFIKTDATLWATGANASGQLGTGNTSNRNTPIQVQTGVASISASSAHSLCVKTNGTLFVTGDNGSAQLGDGTTTNRNSFFQLPAITGVTKAAAGLYHSVFRKSDGTLAAMGWNGQGQLGDGTVIQRTTPVAVTAASNVTDFSAGGTEYTVYITPATP
jgi:alpha-tubulin suppressor-like RCC1 family protein